MNTTKFGNDTQLLLLITKLQAKLLSVVNNALSAHGIRYPHYRLLQILSTHERLHPSRCARELSVESSNLTKQIDALEKMKLISRQYDTHDRRFVWIELNLEGQKIAQAATASVDLSMSNFFSTLKPDNLEALTHLCRDMLLLNSNPNEEVQTLP